MSGTHTLRESDRANSCPTAEAARKVPLSYGPARAALSTGEPPGRRRSPSPGERRHGAPSEGHRGEVTATLVPASLLLAMLVTMGGSPGLGQARSAEAGPPADWPVSDPVVTSGFRPPTAPWAAGHRGVDFAARPGDPVLAMARGLVTYSGMVAGKPIMVLAIGAGRRLTYEPVIPLVPPGAEVAAGDRIGTVSASGGHCAGSCLHVGLRTAGGYLDPMSLLRRRPAVLKPV